MTDFKVGDPVKYVGNEKGVAQTPRLIGMRGVVCGISGFSGDSLDVEFATGVETWLVPTNLIPDVADEPASPVREVRRFEIVPGVYGSVHVGGVDAASQTRALVALSGFTQQVLMTASELRDAARTFNSLAEALEDQS